MSKSIKNPEISRIDREISSNLKAIYSGELGHDEKERLAAVNLDLNRQKATLPATVVLDTSAQDAVDAAVANRRQMGSELMKGINQKILDTSTQLQFTKGEISKAANQVDRAKKMFAIGQGSAESITKAENALKSHQEEKAELKGQIEGLRTELQEASTEALATTPKEE